MQLQSFTWIHAAGRNSRTISQIDLDERGKNFGMATATMQAFSAWLGENNITLNGVRLELSPEGIHVISTRALKEDEPLCEVPEDAVLSLNTAANAATEALLDAEGSWPDSAVQSLVVAYEQSLGVESKWHPYFAASQAADSPLLWNDASLKLLAGTGVDVSARKWRSELREEHRAMQKYLHKHAVADEPVFAAMAALSLESYTQAASLMASRAFFIDDTHGDALVPAADAFNHKVGLAPDDDEDAGDDEEGEGEEDGPRPLRQASASLRAEALSSGIDIEMDCSFSSWGERAADDENEGEEDGGEEDGGEEDDANEGGVRVGQVAMRALPANREVCTTYGEYGNRKLLLDYGFSLADNPLDDAELSWASVEAAGRAVLGEAEWATRVQQLSKTMPCAELDEAFYFDRSGLPPRELQLLLWLLAADALPAPKHAERRFEAATTKQRLPARAKRMLTHAITNQSRQYAFRPGEADGAPKASRKRRAEGGDSEHSAAATPGQLVSITRLVEGEQRIWQSALAWVTR